MDKYLLFVLVLLIAGMGISITRESPRYLEFYGMLSGAIIVILYSSIKSRKAIQEERKRKKSR